MSLFKDTVIQRIRDVPFGKVASYGQIAVYAGVPRAARQVGWILNQSEGTIDLPWWRIVNNEGRISIKGTEFNTPLLQKQMLEREGLSIKDDYSFDIEKYRFRPDKKQLKAWLLTAEYIDSRCAQYL